MTFQQNTMYSTFAPQQWQNIEVGVDYFASFEIVDRTMLHVRTVGNIENFDIDYYYKIREKIIHEYFGKNTPFAEIKDYGNIKGVPNNAMRIKQVKYFWNDLGRCQAFGGYNTSLLMRTVFKTGLRLNKSPFPINVFKHKEDAIAFVKNHSNQTEIQTWTYTNEQTKSKYIFNLRPQNTLFIKYYGDAKVEDIKPALQVLEQVFKKGYIQGPKYTRINDYSEVKGSSPKIRKKYIDELNKLHEKYNCHPERTYVIGAKGIIKATIIIARSFFKYKLIFADSLDEVLKLEKANVKQKQAKYFNISENDVEKLIENIGSIAWEDNKFYFKNIDKNHPFYLIYETLNLIKTDYDHLIKEAKIREKKLERIKDDLEKAHCMKNDFLANITHEIRTPLNTIIGFSSLLQKYNIDNKHSTYIQYIMQSSNALLSMLNDILDIAKLESDKIILNESLCSIKQMLEEIIEYQDMHTNKKNLPIYFHPAPDFPEYVLIDCTRLRQILMNILCNAIKFTPSGKVDIFLQCTRPEQSKINSTIIIKDTGIGIDETNLLEIFQLFSNKKNPKKEYTGNGLGLAIAQKLTAKLGGEIIVESSLGKGSTFIINLKNIHTADNYFITNHLNTSHIDSLRAKIMHSPLAVIELIHNLTAVLSSFTKNIEGKVFFCNYNNNIIDELIQLKPIVIFIDMEIPVMENYSLIKEIKTIKPLKNIPLIAIAKNAEINKEKAISFLGCSQIISNPLNPKEIIESLYNELIAKNQSPEKSSGDNV